MRIFIKISIESWGELMLAMFGQTAFAFNGQDRAHAEPSTTATAAADDTNTTNSSHAEMHHVAVQAKLAETKLRVCQNRERAINNILSRMADRGQKQLDL